AGSDTPQGLKPHGFSESAPSYRHPFLARVRASTHNPQVVRDTILDHGRRGDLAGFPVLVDRQDVDLSHHVAMRLKPTGRAMVGSPPGLVAVLTLRAGLAGVMLVLQLDRGTFGLGLVRDVLADLAVIPLAHPLVLNVAAVHPIGDITDVADDDGAGCLL